MTIRLFAGQDEPFECITLIAVPAAALAEPGHIRLMAADQTGQSKHELFALAQMAFIRFDDGDLKARPVAGAIRIEGEGESLLLEEGAAIGRLSSGDVAVWSNTARAARKYLETAERYCTRWIRLDI